ncbi:Trafficking protein particle complex subunit 2-like protein [Fulvia fulva]|uniref:Trafficking protein particle complex subunit 2-like protein n=1 Tax=Passalora fulva TaxID=5499 RepID=A0A9Q8PL06_PASFU|nr:Trafficking protein particle complex subunit 2-like protein [Fulvia fulva]KAK4610434.1 Trafficking protein particle complex subunit 2-like protein [Fulvia fulva]KAK4610859.1 Trafficking protein particle complex subunit 2-like protein [Fulvia fulva]UJO24408.1 Trafficking protein particle complex subunit 2-like protein [Fulvia fulva]WPV22025.1 Trafficking protein particle complex subunit 2-like protein [Fulvia fulva]WPV36827.1 Trafficking protein particle complex subunit 2-like protein [Fulvi
MDRSPSIAAIGVIGRHNNPLHVALFPATYQDKEEPRDQLEYEMMLNSSLDIFEARIPSKTVGQDFGLLHALDERIALYGWLLNTGVKLVIVVDMEGRVAPNSEAVKTSMLGLRNSDLSPAFQALQTAYIRLLRNPFYTPDDHDPKTAKTRGNMQITSSRFIKEIDNIGKNWYPGALNL